MDLQLEELPTELLEKIVTYIGLVSLVRFSRCSRRCREASFEGDPAAFRRIDLYEAQLADRGVKLSKFDDAAFAALVKYPAVRAGLRFLRLDYSRVTSTSFLAALACPNIVQISVNSCDGVEFAPRYIGSLIRRLRFREGWEGEGNDNIMPNERLPPTLRRIGVWGTTLHLPSGQKRAFELMHRTIVDQMLVAGLDLTTLLWAPGCLEIPYCTSCRHEESVAELNALFNLCSMCRRYRHLCFLCNRKSCMDCVRAAADAVEVEAVVEL